MSLMRRGARTRPASVVPSGRPNSATRETPLMPTCHPDHVALLAHLSTQHGVPCTVSQGRGHGSYAYIRQRHITLGSRATFWTCYHEFAHLLLDQRVPGQGHLHNRAFFQALCDALPDPRAYPWQREYTRLHHWATHAGLASLPGITRRNAPTGHLLAN